ncbi:MAG: VCBS repeat-containing protein, partial [Ferruginibacter sp.]
IPHAESTRGPKLAVADVNKDGLDDFYACGAKGQSGALMIQTKDGKFISSDTAQFRKQVQSEDVDAVFFDANKDGFPDLYVVSGGNEDIDGNPGLADRLYLNDGKGHFILATGKLPSMLTNKSCVAAADIDKDGDIDLFVGGLTNARQYGFPAPSYLLLNDGTGNFKQAQSSTISLAETGIVTTSVFTDINNDGWTDLVIAGEWMPVKIFLNNKGVFKETAVAASTGLWQKIYAADINGDGFTDLLAGNWGHNSKLSAGKNGPLKLYVKDFDKNGSVDQVMAYTVDGKEYTFLAKDELERDMPVLKKAYLNYGEVAGKTVQYMFYDLLKDYKELKAEILGSSCFINDGKGNFTKMELPPDLQMAPVFSFTSLPYNNSLRWLAGGNFYGVVPYEGRYDALAPTAFSFAKNARAFHVEQKLSSVSGEVRDQQWLNTAGGQKILIIARNNQPLLFYKLPKKG